MINHLQGVMNESGEKAKCILVTGGTGYIGSHAVLALLQANYKVTVVDNLVNSTVESLNRVRKLANCSDAMLQFYQADLQNRSALEVVFQSAGPFDACIHFAGLKAVGESVEKSLLYYGIRV